MLADVGRHVSIAARQFIQEFDDPLRLDQAGIPVEAQAVHGLPVLDQAPPVIYVGPFPDALQPVIDILQHVLDVTDDGDIHGYVLGNGGRVDVDMDDPCVGAEFLQVSGYAVIEARADGDQHVALVHRHIGFVGAVHSQHADELRVRSRVCPQAHQGIGDGKPQGAGEFGQLRVGIGQDNAAAGVDHRFTRLQHQVDCPFDLPRVAFYGRPVGSHVHRIRVLVGAGICRHVLGNVHHDGTGTAGAGDEKRLLNDAGQVFHIADEEIVFYTGPGNADGIHLLEGIVTDIGSGNLAAENDQGDGIHVCRCNTGNGIGDTRTGGDQHHAGTARSPGVAVRRVRGALLVANQDMFHLGLFVQFVVNMQYGAAGVAENVFYPFIFQGPDEDFGPAHYRFCFSHRLIPQVA